VTSLLTDDLRGLLGRTATYTAADPLGRPALRYFATAVGDHNPVYTDDDAARAAGYDGVVAPPTLVCETNQFVNNPRDEDGFPGHEWGIHLPGTRLVRGGNDYRFHQPVTPDDVITVTWAITDLTERTTGAGQPMLVVTSTARFTNQHDVLLVENTETLIYIGSAA
jgi:acyl dehydratase